jgi:hypothetical protein
MPTIPYQVDAPDLPGGLRGGALVLVLQTILGKTGGFILWANSERFSEISMRIVSGFHPPQMGPKNITRQESLAG